MSQLAVFRTHPRLRWAVPVLTLGAVVATSVAVGAGGASAEDSLGPRTPAQLLVDVQQARLAGLSGTVVQTSNLGLPDLPGMAGQSSDLMSTLTGSHTWRVWYAGPDRARLALVGSQGESDVVRNGKDVWLWSSSSKSATHYTLSAEDAARTGTPTPSSMPTTPQQAADAALAALDPSTEVTSPGTITVAGRPAYELVLKPRQSGSLVAQVRIAVDGSQHIPLRVQVFSTRVSEPAVEVGFTSVDFAVPDAHQFSFTPPPGTKVTEQGSGSTPGAAPSVKPSAAPSPQQPGAAASADRPRTVGSGWATVVLARTGTLDGAADSTGQTGDQLAQLEGILASLPKVSGSWGSGRLFTGTLFSAVLTDDGRLAVGAVQPQRLYDALATR
ncbi:MAG: hypothetical protein IPJ14_20100 [Kineosporiaceae bacterium]|nr:hypothetical protein [Kineosporiaceae bacterium]MBK7624893.1 hypothetical protein [Kineosporiaceae bacterium]MBK8076728.1 hypothetical protein [Kineosporiaceae bacterium]